MFGLQGMGRAGSPPAPSQAVLLSHPVQTQSNSHLREVEKVPRDLPLIPSFVVSLCLPPAVSEHYPLSLQVRELTMLCRCWAE